MHIGSVLYGFSLPTPIVDHDWQLKSQKLGTRKNTIADRGIMVFWGIFCHPQNQWRNQEKCSGGGPRFEGKSYKGSLGVGVCKGAEPPCRGPGAEPLVGVRGQSPRKILEKFMKIYYRK